MKKLAMLFLLVVLVVVFSAQTQKKPRATGTTGTAGSAAAELVEMENMWIDAVMKKDPTMLDRMYADDVTIVSPTGELTTKEKDLEDLRSGNFAVDSVTNSDLKTRTYGNTGVVTGVADMKGKYMGEDISGRYRFTDTFVKQNGQWKLVATQVTKIMDEKK